MNAAEQLMRWENGVVRVHREAEEARQRAAAIQREVYVQLLCDCGHTMGGSILCDHCHSLPSHAVEVQITPMSRLVLALERLAG